MSLYKSVETTPAGGGGGLMASLGGGTVTFTGGPVNALAQLHTAFKGGKAGVRDMPVLLKMALAASTLIGLAPCTCDLFDVEKPDGTHYYPDDPGACVFTLVLWIACMLGLVAFFAPVMVLKQAPPAPPQATISSWTNMVVWNFVGMLCLMMLFIDVDPFTVMMAALLLTLLATAFICLGQSLGDRFGLQFPMGQQHAEHKRYACLSCTLVVQFFLAMIVISTFVAGQPDDEFSFKVQPRLHVASKSLNP